MKNIVLYSLAFLLSLSSYSQEEPVFQKKGKILVETGYGLLGGYSSGTGLNFLADSETLTSIGANIGAFVTENLALKLNLGILSGDGPSITNITGGAKYYLGGRVPIELKAGFIDFGEESSEIASLTVGYAAKLADNIYLEPIAGLSATNDTGSIVFSVNFALIL